MIAKEISAPKKTNSFGGLARYITNEEKEGTIDYSKITNCISEDLSSAIKEIEMTQKVNKVSKSNKVYHLVVSFAEGEVFTNQQLEDIEERLVKAVGYEKHQRISALHNDTNNVHLHLAINTIDPENFNNVKPSFSKKKLMSECKLIEIDYGLKLTHKNTNEVFSNNDENLNENAAAMEIHQNKESLLSWIKNNVLDDIKQLNSVEGASLDDLHKLLESNSLYLKKRGNGLVVVDHKSKKTVKASSVYRELSKKSLERKYGDFKIFDFNSKNVKNAFKSNKMENDNSVLYDKFLMKKESIAKERAILIKKAGERKFQFLKDNYAILNKRRAELKQSDLHWTRKKRVRESLDLQERQKKSEAQKYYAEQRILITKSLPKLGWVDFLKEEALKGSEDAIKALRSTKQSNNSNYSSDTIYWNKVKNESVDYEGVKLLINKKGQVRYQLSDKESVFVDKNGIRPNTRSDNAIKVSLDLAVKKYGKRFTVKGSDEFINAIQNEAKKQKMDLTINNKRMMRRGQGNER